MLALEIDRVGLYGSGSSNQPLGLKDTTGVLSEDFAANTPTFAEVVALESDVSGANALLGSPVYVMNAAMAGSLKTATKDSGSGQFILQGGEVNGYRAVISNQVASNDLWFGNFSDLIIAYFSGLDLMVDPSLAAPPAPSAWLLCRMWTSQPATARASHAVTTPSDHEDRDP